MSLVRTIFNFLRFNKKNWKAVVLCIFAAMVFWFFNALNKSYSTNINFPIAFEYDQDRYIPVKSLPAVVRMNVTGSGWDLFRRSLGFKVPPLVVPLENPSDVKKIVGTTLPAIFAGQLERLKINFVITDTVRLHIEERIRRKFTVSIDSVEQYIHPEFGLSSAPVLTPDTVWIEGPKDVISHLSSTLVISLPQKNIRKEYNEDIELNPDNHPGLSYQPEKVNVAIAVEKFENVESRLKLDILNVPYRLKQGGVAKEISCTFRLPTSIAKTISPDSLRAVINLKNKSAGRYKLIPEITGLPKSAQIIKTDTVVVNF